MSKYQLLTQTLQKIRKSEERLKILIENKESLEEKVSLRKTELDKENYDVEKLEGLSLVGFVHFIKGTLIDKLDKEEREALVAKNKYDLVCNELEFCFKEIEIYRERVKNKYVVEREYLEFIKSQEMQILNSDAEKSKRIREVTEKIYYNNEVLKEIREAVEAGVELYNSFLCVYKSFVDASDLGLVNLLESGLLVTDCKHSEIKETNQEIVLIQQLIRKFHIELLDVSNIYNFEIDEGELVSFSDNFLEGVVAESTVECKIEFAKEKVKAVIVKIKLLIEALKDCKSTVLEENNDMSEEKIGLIESYLSKDGGIL